MRLRLRGAEHPPRSCAVFFVVGVGRNRCDRLKYALLPVAEHNLVVGLCRLFKIPLPAQADAAPTVSRHIKGFPSQSGIGGQCLRPHHKGEHQSQE